MRIKINRSETRALNNLRGLPDDVHMMLMTMTFADDGGVLDGTKETFDFLVEFIGELLAEEMLSDRDASVLTSLCQKIDPGCVDWLGC